MRRLSALLALLMLLTLLAGCTRDEESADSVDSPVVLNYYTIGEPDRDLAEVNRALNRILLEKYGFTVNYHKVGWTDYEKYLVAMINTNQPFDIAFTWADNYETYAVEGTWLDLTPYMQTEGAQMYQAIDEKFWKGVQVDGKLLGVPTNKELAVPLQFVFCRELVEKYGIDVSNYRTFHSLMPLLKLIAENEPEYIPLFFDASHYDLMSTLGYEYITETLPLVIRSDSGRCRLVNGFENEEVRSLLRTMRRYYQAGYINADASIRTYISRFDDEKIFLRLASGGPDIDVSLSGSFGYGVIAVQAAKGIATTASARAAVMAVSAHSEHPREAVQFLNALNTDPEIRNLLNFGIEGVHYVLTDEGQVRSISNGYQGVTYTQGNWFILRTREGESLDRWEVFEKFNAATQESALLGFMPDYSAHADILSEVTRIYEKYYSPLITGTVDPDVYVPRMNEELNAAGLDVLREDLQAQIDAWLAEKSARSTVQNSGTAA